MHKRSSRRKSAPKKKAAYKGSNVGSRYTVSPGTVKGNKLWWRGTKTII